MNIPQLMKISSVVLWCSVVFLSGCATFLKPEAGAIARQEARIDLTEKSVQEDLWKTKDLQLAYSITKSDSTFNFRGELVFDQSLTYSFGTIERFSLKMSFLDGEGRVLETVDITPMYAAFGSVPDRLSIKASGAEPAGAAAIAFNYFGLFKGDNNEMGGSDWQIFYFPFE
jgi:hypothetical protein